MSMNENTNQNTIVEAIPERMSGNEAVAYAIRQVNPDVMPAFPITPSTEIPQMVSTYISNGQLDTEFIPVESEHSAIDHKSDKAFLVSHIMYLRNIYDVD